VSSCLVFYRTDKGGDIDGIWMCGIPKFDRYIQLWDAEAKAHMMAYDMQLKDFTTMYDEEANSKRV
jgi:hypothetical protein